MGSTDVSKPHVNDDRLDPAPLSRQQLLDEVRKLLAISDSYIFEVQHFFDAISGRVKVPRATGLPAFIRSSLREREAIECAQSELADEGSDLDETALALIKRRIETSAAIVRHDAVHWDVLKRCHSLVAVNQTFQGSDKETRRREVSQVSGDGRQKQQLHRTLKEQGKVEVHVVDGGGEWIDVRWLQADRLARQMADNGWGWGEHELGDDVDPAEWEDMPLAKQVRRLVVAARINRYEYRIPRVRIVMPNLGRGASMDVDVLLDQFTRLHPSVEVVVEDATGEFLTRACPDLKLATKNLLGDDKAGLTATLNMDHTILIDLVSDLTHSRLRPQPWQDRTTRAQIEEENGHGGLMARTLYPILQDRLLVCTREAAEHFHAVLDAVGTPTEKERGRILVPWDGGRDGASPTAPAPAPPEASEGKRRRFQDLSIHLVPDSLQIPIQVLSSEWTIPTVEAAVASGALPLVALDVARCGGFKSSKLSIYMYGWASGTTTVTSNKEISGQIKTWVEAHRRSDDETGPSIWRIDVTRNLLAKNATSPPGRAVSLDP
ncbi:UPF0415 protein [Escovopsis weberi]|uniref:UPF0415 protein n=1 Tax=Escovopsis weberi TaxID=150374 RepID=A0A0M8N999_ESCWE|nr:UPF0415 protein [Escovopsis weberi]